jgi:hypothetical protein
LKNDPIKNISQNNIIKKTLLIKNRMSNFIGDGQFEFVNDFSRAYFISAHKTISQCELWGWLRDFEPDPERGFMYTRGVPELDRIKKTLFQDPVNEGHSGASYAITMRNMSYIAKNGYEAFRNKITFELKV